MKLSKIISASCGAALLTGAASAATMNPDSIYYSLADDGVTLVTVTASGTSVVDLTLGGNAQALDALAYRPQTDQLYGYDDNSDSAFLIDTVTGEVTFQASGGGDVNTQTTTDNVGFDFNNTIDAARIVSANDENRVFFPNNTPQNIAGLPNIMDLFFEPGDANEGLNPTISMNAYTNAVANASTTLQYVIDTELDMLGTLNNNAGNITTIGALTDTSGNLVNISDFGGFDILSFSEGDNTGLGLFSIQATGNQAFYEIDLSTGIIDFITDAPNGPLRPLNGFAAAPVSAVPLPLPAAMLGGGLLTLLGLCRFKRNA